MDTGYLIDKVVGSGTFGMVYLAQEKDTNQKVALKKVFQDRRYKNREHLIMEELNHPCIVKLRKAFFTKGEEQKDVYLNLVMDYIPETLSTSIRNARRSKQNFSQTLIKVYAYQMLRGLAYLKVIKICHRDLKPQNVLIDPSNYQLKICDFGSAKKLEFGQANIAYICSRFYRAPELILGKTDYDTAVDMWSLGCIIAEMQLLEPIFPGDNAQDQFVQIIKILGTPNKQQIQDMALTQNIENMPILNGKNFQLLFNKADNQFIDLIQKMLNFSPKQRIQPIDALLHPYFDEIRKQGFEIGGIIPQDLFNFTNEELQIEDEVRQKLIPGWLNK